MKHVLPPKTAVREYNHVLDFPKIGKFYDLYEKQTTKHEMATKKTSTTVREVSVVCWGIKKTLKPIFLVFSIHVSNKFK